MKTTATTLELSAYSYTAWVTALASGDAVGSCRTPSGARITRVLRVKPGERIAIVESGHQTFGSGGFVAISAGVRSDGSPVTIDGEPEHRSTGFTREVLVHVVFEPGMVVVCCRSDAIGSTGRDSRTVYICDCEVPE